MDQSSAAALDGSRLSWRRQADPIWVSRTPTPSEGGGDLDIGAVLAELGSGFAGGDIHLGLAPVVLDFAELKRRGTQPTDA